MQTRTHSRHGAVTRQKPSRIEPHQVTVLVRVGNLATRKHFGPERVNGPATENHSADALMSGAEHVEALLKHKAAGNECYKNKDYAGAIAAYGEAAKLLPRFPYDDDSDDEGGPSAAEIVAKMDPELLKQGAVRGCRTPKAQRISRHVPTIAFTLFFRSVPATRLCFAIVPPPTWRSTSRSRLSPMLSAQQPATPPTGKLIGAQVSRS